MSQISNNNGCVCVCGSQMATQEVTMQMASQLSQLSDAGSGEQLSDIMAFLERSSAVDGRIGTNNKQFASLFRPFLVYMIR